MRALIIAIALSLCAPAVAEEPVTDPSAQAEAVRVRGMMQKRAGKNAWSGVEQNYEKLKQLGVPLQAADHALAAQSARNLGDSWHAYQRLVMAIQLDESFEGLHDQMRVLREGYGRLTVRRVEATPMSLAKSEMPFVPDERASVDFAAGKLRETGGFDGMVPVGSYTVGTHAVEVPAGLKPVVVQRVLGD